MLSSELSLHAITQDRSTPMDPSPISSASATAADERIPPTAPLGNEPRWSANQLLKGSKEALIVHGELVYRLRLTRSGKLILYK